MHKGRILMLFGCSLQDIRCQETILYPEESTILR